MSMAHSLADKPEWIEHNGGQETRPGDNDYVEVESRDGLRSEGLARAITWDWHQRNSDIVRYRKMAMTVKREAKVNFVLADPYGLPEPSAFLLSAPGYDTLAAVLHDAFDQASRGKGHERHADGMPFDEQPMQQIGDRRGIGFILGLLVGLAEDEPDTATIPDLLHGLFIKGHADKKSEEAQGMYERGEIDAAIRELHGAINYLAGAVIYMERHRND